MMKQSFLIPTLFLLVGLFSSFDEKSVPDVTDYISKYKAIAVEEMHRSGIPASITLAQGLHESGIGKGKLALNSNNHFGIKCKKNWKGESFYWKDDDKDANGKLIESCFRVYTNVRQSYADHTDFLLNNKRYHPLFELDRKDYVSWAKGLKSCGYATDKKYAEKLIGTIERYGLQKFDNVEIAIVENDDDDDESLDSDEAYDEGISIDVITDPVGNIPSAKRLPDDYQRHMYATDDTNVLPKQTTTPAIEYIQPPTNETIPAVQEQEIIETPQEEQTSPMLIPEEPEEESSRIVEDKNTQLTAPTYNISAFSSTKLTPAPIKETKEKVKKPKRSKDKLIQIVRKPRISRK